MWSRRFGEPLPGFDTTPVVAAETAVLFTVATEAPGWAAR